MSDILSIYLRFKAVIKVCPLGVFRGKVGICMAGLGNTLDIVFVLFIWKNIAKMFG